MLGTKIEEIEAEREHEGRERKSRNPISSPRVSFFNQKYVLSSQSGWSAVLILGV